MKSFKAKLRLVESGNSVEDDKVVELVCRHARVWPPPLVRLGVKYEAAWRAGDINQHDYQKVRTWQTVCGLMEMEEKCWTCPQAQVRHVRPGSDRVEITDLSKVQSERLKERHLDRQKQARKK